MRASVLGAKKAAIEAKEERQSILSGSRPVRQKEPRERLHYKPGSEPHTPGLYFPKHVCSMLNTVHNVPAFLPTFSACMQKGFTFGLAIIAGSAPWAANYGRKKLPRSAEATLERIFDESPYPSEAVVKGLFDLHRLPRRRVLDWFAQRRRERNIRNDDRSASNQAHELEQR